MTSLGECLHFNMKNILTWFSRKSHLNMLWFQMKLSHFDSPEPLSARIHLAFSFLQRGTCSVKSHDQELPSLWRTLWIRPQSIKERSLMGWAMESPQKEGYCRYCRMVYSIHVSILACYRPYSLVNPNQRNIWDHIELNILVVLLYLNQIVKVHSLQRHLLRDHHSKSSWDKHACQVQSILFMGYPGPLASSGLPWA